MLQQRHFILRDLFISRIDLYVACSATICLAVLLGVGLLTDHLLLLVFLLGVFVISAFFFRPKETLIGLLIIRTSLDPFHHIRFFDIINIAGVFSILLLICGTIILLKYQGLIKGKIFIYLMIFLIISLISTFFSDNVIFSLNEYARLCSSFIIIPLVTILFRDSRSRYNLFKILLLALIVPMILAIIQLFTQSSIDRTGFNRLTGASVHPAGFAHLLLVFVGAYVCFLLEKKYFIKKYLLLLVLGSIVLLTMFSYQRGVWIGLIIIFMVLGIIRYRRILFILPILVVLLIFFVPSLTERTKDLYNEKYYGRFSVNSFEARLNIWNRTFQGVLEKPILGHGIGMVEVHVGREAHNDYLRIFYETGLSGLIIFFVILLSFLSLSYRCYTKFPDSWEHPLALGMFSLIIAYIVLFSADNIISHPAIWWYLSAFMGILYSAMNEYSTQENK